VQVVPQVVMLFVVRLVGYVVPSMSVVVAVTSSAYGRGHG